MPNRILFAGGSGFVGHILTTYLLEAGYGVRILSRHPERTLKTAPPGSEVIYGDVTRPDTLRDACIGCRFMAIALSGQTEPSHFFAVEGDGVANLSQAATESGVERIAMVSGAGIDSNRNEYFVSAKYLGERTLLDNKIPAAIFRSSWFMESLPRMVVGPIAAVPGPHPHPVHFVAMKDLASMIARSFVLDPSPEGIFYAYGPELITVEDALRSYCRTLTPARLILHVPLSLVSTGASVFGGRARFLHDLLKYLNDVTEPDASGSETLHVFGSNPTTLDTWLLDRKRTYRRNLV